jgi:hypothetical protein
MATPENLEYHTERSVQLTTTGKTHPAHGFFTGMEDKHNVHLIFWLSRGFLREWPCLP